MAAKRGYSKSEVRGSGRACQAAMAQERLRGATQVQGQGSRGRSYPTSEVGGVAERSYPLAREARGGQEEPSVPEVRDNGGGATLRPRPGWWPGGER